MPAAEYHLLDVFTDTPYAGNPLAVFVDPPALTTDQMQALARELNLSESVFVSNPSDDHRWPTRIFTASTELPFAGHPTIGTAITLADLGRVEEEVTLAEGVGDVVVRLERGGGTWRATLTAAQLPIEVETAGVPALAAALGLVASDFHPDLPPIGLSCGIPFAFVPVASVDVLARSTVDVAAWQSQVAGHPADQLAVIAPLGDVDGPDWQMRMFAPGFGIVEDPATGSAAAAAAGLLAPLGAGPWRIRQGVEMGRPSLLEVSVDRDPSGNLTAVRVTGAAVMVGHGSLVVP